MSRDFDAACNPNSHEDRRALTGARWQEAERIALRVGEAEWRHSTLAELSARRAAELRRQGLRAGEVVLCPTWPVLDSVLMQRAVAALGGALFPVPPDLSRDQRAPLIDGCGAEWLWAPAQQQLQPTLARGSHGSANAGDQGACAPAVLVQTSGSSAAPKSVMLSAANIVASCARVNARLALGPDDAWLCALPRQHVGGLAIGYRCTLAGCAMRVQARFEPSALHRALQEDGITHVSLVPAMLQRLLEQDLAPPATLRVALLGGQALDAGLARRARAAGWPLYLGYGMSETFSQIAGAWVEDGDALDQGLVPLAGVRLEAPGCDASDASRAGKTRLRLRGPMLMLGYANPARLPGAGLEQGWLRTGDLACRSSDGRLRIQGRADEVLIVGGRNVLPADVEQRLAALDGLGEVAVVGLPEAAWGHRLVALYTGPRPPASLERWARATLPSSLRPRGFVQLAELPRLASGKPDRRALVQRAAVALSSERGR